MIYSYRVYGLTLCSDAPVFALPNRLLHCERPDVVLNLREKPEWVREAERLPRQLERPRPGKAEGDDSPFALTSFGDSEFFELAYADEARFFVDRHARRVWGTCRPPFTDEDIATYLLGPVMGFVLRRRGVTALHASAVCLLHHAAILCGPSESGKSTTAAALALRGVRVLTEDISALVEIKGSLYVEAGYPRVCLWPDAVMTLFGTTEALPKLTPTWEKRYLRLKEGFEPEKRTLRVIYVFAPRVTEPHAPRIEELGPREALLELVQNTYMNWLLDRCQRVAELDMLTKLVATVPVRRIVPHADPARIGDLCDVLISDAERASQRQSFAAAGSLR